METWSVHHLDNAIRKNYCDNLCIDIQRYALNLKQSSLPVIFSLGHLSYITGINYRMLHETVNRKREIANYKLFSIGKRSGGRRFIHAVNGKLFYLQKYLNDEILQKVSPHPASFAFHKSGGIKRCAAVHSGCKWLLQFDLKDFFYTISEPMVYHVFLKMGYKRLLAFELARLCTTLHLPRTMKSDYIINKRIGNITEYDFGKYNGKPYFCQKNIGVLPQGAPTSPMISNLAALRLDELLYTYALKNNFVYTRYADDLTFSTNKLPNQSISQIKREIISLIRKSGFRENRKKIRIAGPGSKKIVLGLLVDGDIPRISRELLKRIDRNLYSIKKYGLQKASKHDGFESGYGYCNHVSGLISFINDVSPKQLEKIREKYGDLHKLVS